MPLTGVAKLSGYCSDTHRRSYLEGKREARSEVLRGVLAVVRLTGTATWLATLAAPAGALGGVAVTAAGVLANGSASLSVGVALAGGCPLTALAAPALSLSLGDGCARASGYADATLAVNGTALVGSGALNFSSCGGGGAATWTATLSLAHASIGAVNVSALAAVATLAPGASCWATALNGSARLGGVARVTLRGASGGDSPGVALSASLLGSASSAPALAPGAPRARRAARGAVGWRWRARTAR